MANVKRCDRCGWCYDKMEHGSGLISMNVYGKAIKDNIDLCEKCTSKLIDWIADSEEEFKEKEENHD